jgi:hypothetical protein
MVWAAISAALGAVMLVAGLPKLGDREGMIRVVRGYELPGDLDVGDRLAGGALGVTVVALVAVALTALSVMNLGRRPVDDYLTDAAIEMRTVSASKY